MNPSERRLSSLLHDLTPEPPQVISLADVASRLKGGPPDQTLEEVHDVEDWRRRWLPLGPMIAAAAAIVVVAGSVAVAARLHESHLGAAGSGTPTAGGSTSSAVATSSSPTSSSNPVLVTACVAGQLSASLVRSAAVASQPFAIIGLTNTGAHVCALSGYPSVQLWGYAGAGATGRSGQLAVAVTHGPIYEVSNSGAVQVVLRRGGSASFAVGFGTGYSATYTIVRVAVLAGPKTVYIELPLHALASAPRAGGPIPVGETALVAGLAG
jgi:hypothetical protein